MNKLTLIDSALVLVFIIMLMSCGFSTSVNIDKTDENEGTNYNKKIDSIVVSYLSWDLRTRGALSCEDVKDYNNGKNERYVVINKVEIEHFVNALSLVEFKLISKLEKADIRMVLDFYSEGLIEKEVCLNYTRSIFNDNNLYRSMSLYKIIEDYIPKTEAPLSHN